MHGQAANEHAHSINSPQNKGPSSMPVAVQSISPSQKSVSSTQVTLPFPKH